MAAIPKSKTRFNPFQEKVPRNVSPLHAFMNERKAYPGGVDSWDAQALRNEWCTAQELAMIAKEAAAELLDENATAKPISALRESVGLVYMILQGSPLGGALPIELQKALEPYDPDWVQRLEEQRFALFQIHAAARFDPVQSKRHGLADPVEAARQQQLSKVWVCAYDMSRGFVQEELTNKQLQNPQARRLTGIWHISVIAFGREYEYGQQIRATPLPVGMTAERLMERRKQDKVTDPITRKVVPMYLTQAHDMPPGLDATTFDNYVSVLRQDRFARGLYNPLENNCIHFADDILTFLLGKPVLSDYTDIVDLASQESTDNAIGIMNACLKAGMKKALGRTCLAAMNQVGEASRVGELYSLFWGWTKHTEVQNPDNPNQVMVLDVQPRIDVSHNEGQLFLNGFAEGIRVSDDIAAEQLLLMAPSAPEDADAVLQALTSGLAL